MKHSSKTQYFSFSNDFDGKTGIVTLAIKSNNDKKKEVLRVGYFLTEPGSKFDRKNAEKEANKLINSNMCVLMCGRASSGTMGDTVRLAWEAAIKTCCGTYALPNWALKLDLAQKAHLI